jgi:hypothetical protein
LCSVGYINPTGAVAGVRRENSSNWIAWVGSSSSSRVESSLRYVEI